MTTPQKTSISPDTNPEAVPSRIRIRFGLILTVLGFLVFIVGARPALFGLDRSPTVGFLQIAVFLIGLAIICLGGYISLMAFWKNGGRTIAADIGQRLVATGYVITVVSGMADIFGMGSHVPPHFAPFFGPWQATGVQLGEAIIAMGFLLLIPYRMSRSKA